MDNNEINSYVDKIYNKLFSIEGEKKSEEDKQKIIKSILLQFGHEHRQIGRLQILNHFKTEINNLKRSEETPLEYFKNNF